MQPSLPSTFTVLSSRHPTQTLKWASLSPLPPALQPSIPGSGTLHRPPLQGRSAGSTGGLTFAGFSPLLQWLWDSSVILFQTGPSFWFNVTRVDTCFIFCLTRMSGWGGIFTSLLNAAGGDNEKPESVLLSGFQGICKSWPRARFQWDLDPGVLWKQNSSPPWPAPSLLGVFDPIQAWWRTPAMPALRRRKAG